MSRMSRQARSLMKIAQSTSTHGMFTSWQRQSANICIRKAVEAARKTNLHQEIVIGHIDRNGRVVGPFGELPGLEPVDKADFVERDCSQLDVVLLEGHIFVRKDFRGKRGPFLREWYALVTLYGKANIPAVYKVDEDRCRIYADLILGRTVGLILADADAKTLATQTKHDSESKRLNHTLRIEGVSPKGRAAVPSCISEGFLCQVEQQLAIMHAHGVTNFGLSVGDIIMDSETGSPWFTSFEEARVHRSKSSLSFAFGRDRDRVKLNQTYGRDLMTEGSARAKLAAHLPWKYAPIDFGNGLTVGAFWSIREGTGRWEFLNKHVMPPLTGKRVLDLGSNNGSMPMLMLRAGASQVIGLEISPREVEKAQLVHNIYEWRDMCKYALQIHNCNMLRILDTDWGKFDMVTALCSLYYLESDDMARVVRRASELAPTMVLQANIGGSRRMKASVTFLKQLLEKNGFPQVDVFAPPNYARPLLVGRHS